MGFFDFLKKKAKAVAKHSPVGVSDFVDVPDASDVVGVDVPNVPTSKSDLAAAAGIPDVPTSASDVAAQAGVDVPGTHDLPGADAVNQARDAADTARAAQDLAHAASDDPDKSN